MAIIRRDACCADAMERTRGLEAETPSDVTDLAAITPAFDAERRQAITVSGHPQGSVSDWPEMGCIY
jgi:hypothetical protein